MLAPPSASADAGERARGCATSGEASSTSSDIPSPVSASFRPTTARVDLLGARAVDRDPVRSRGERTGAVGSGPAADVERSGGGFAAVVDNSEDEAMEVDRRRAAAA